LFSVYRELRFPTWEPIFWIDRGFSSPEHRIYDRTERFSGVRATIDNFAEALLSRLDLNSLAGERLKPLPKNASTPFHTERKMHGRYINAKWSGSLVKRFSLSSDARI